MCHHMYLPWLRATLQELRTCSAVCLSRLRAHVRSFFISHCTKFAFEDRRSYIALIRKLILSVASATSHSIQLWDKYKQDTPHFPGKPHLSIACRPAEAYSKASDPRLVSFRDELYRLPRLLTDPWYILTGYLEADIFILSFWIGFETSSE
ncbi:hypothetical protein PoB_005943800 [Plakobranchus ocellatus]|uniref:Uncharacterized protein n=1 Tax=Plakobranchus ocellatus TaxID=259542 RepID=A0AAV4CLE0_9GAST|nr:hypothetical protein PoB_005943800 [Plakobranchus ocellatus]